MSGKMRPTLLNQVLEELNVMERQAHPALGKAKRDCIRELIREKQERSEMCENCSGIVYRQTKSGKIIPADEQCSAKITPPCYQPDGDGCAYQTYGDGGEPIDKCKECPHCYTDKLRRSTPQNAPLTLEELRGMEQERVWVQYRDLGMYALVAYHADPDGDDGDDVYLTNNLGGRSTYEEIISEGGVVYRRPPEQ